MANSTIEILQHLTRGTEARLYADSFTLQLAKYGFYAFAVLCAAVALYLAFTHFGAARKSIGTLIGVVLMIAAAYFLYNKAGDYKIIDDQEPVIEITATSLVYDVRKDGWTVNWGDIDHVEVVSTRTLAKQSVAQTTNEVRVYVKSDEAVRWKYDGSDETRAARQVLFAAHYVVIDYGLLGINPQLLADALENYRKG